MKIRFKHQPYQMAAVEAVADCFVGQPYDDGVGYRVDPGRRQALPQMAMAQLDEKPGVKNAELRLNPTLLLDNVKAVQGPQNLQPSAALVGTAASALNLDVEMETGTGKTYVYLKTIFELNKRHGWSKFIVVVPSIAIREGVYKTLEMTAEHFLDDYGKKARFFIYNSKQLHALESFSSDAGINVMVINVQAFNSAGKDQRRIYEELDDFQSRKPIDVIKQNRPILILDEPQKMEGKKTTESLTHFNSLFILRYSATHKTEHNKVHRLDALDAYNQKLVKKIAVRGITTRGLSGTSGYVYLESIEVSKSKPPEARMELEFQQKNGIKRMLRKIRRNDNLQELTGLNQYSGYVVAQIDARDNTVEFSNGVVVSAGEALGDISEALLRRIQIRETIRAHFAKERLLFERGVKVLSLFFIDEVAKYRQYDDSGAQSGEYAQIFEEEYSRQLDEALDLFSAETEYGRYLRQFEAATVHDGYFSIDKKKRIVNSAVKTRGEMAGQSDDVDAYDLILKDKERLLSFDEPVRFIFSHSALREGWDNPNVFVICTLKHSDNTVSRRQEVGRGLRIAVDQRGERMDDPATVHDINVLTVVANESYQDFVGGLQKDIIETLAARPRVADEDYFAGKLLKTDSGDITVTPQLAKQLYRYLVKNDYSDENDRIAEAYHQAKRDGTLAPLPDALSPYADQVFLLIDSVFCDAALPAVTDDRAIRSNKLNDNFKKKEFQTLWSRINRKAIYTVQFDSNELVDKCVGHLNVHLKVKPLQFSIQRGEQKTDMNYDDLSQGGGFEVREQEAEYHTESVGSGVRYDLLGSLGEQTQLTRQTLALILSRLPAPTFQQYQVNPEDFIHQASRLINEQKATAVVEHLSYNALDDSFDQSIFTKEQLGGDFGKAFEAENHVYDYVFTDSKTERRFVEALDKSLEVVVYAKLPKGFHILTPVGQYNPDWAIAFDEDKVRHVYFVAETKGSMSSLELREIERSKIACAKKFFEGINAETVRYDVVDSWASLLDIVEPVET